MSGPGEFFSWAEVQRSAHARRWNIDNTAGPDIQWAAQAWCQHFGDPLRRLIGPITPTSWFRCLDLNRAVGSRDSSQHIRGEAVDFKSGVMTAEEIAQVVRAAGLPFDQFIGYEPKTGRPCVHVSYTMRRRNRGQFWWQPAEGKPHLWDF